MLERFSKRLMTEGRGGFRDAALGSVDIRLNFAKGNWALSKLAIGMEYGILRVLPALLN